MKTKKFLSSPTSITLLIMFVVALFIPHVVSSYNLRILILGEIYMIFSMSLNLLMGVAGTVSFGHAAFYGIGAYTASLFLTRLGWSFLPTLPFIVLISGFAGMLLALPMSRVTGRYVTIVTLGFCEIVNIILVNWKSLTRGPMGIMNIKRPTVFGYLFKSNKSYFYFVLFFVVVVYILINWTLKSKLGRNLKAIRDDSIAAEAMGVKLFPNKVFVFSMSAALAGLAGALYAHYMGYIDPAAFTSNESFVCISIVVMGGLGNMLGSMIGSLVLMALPEYLRGFDKYRMIIYGVVLVLIMWLNHSILGDRIKSAVAAKWRQLKNMLRGQKGEAK